MFKIIYFVVCLSAAFSFSLSAQSRIVSLGSISTEILYDLGYNDKVVAVDATSSFYSDKTNLGHGKKITLEGILSVKPDFVIGSKDILTDKLKNQLDNIGIKTLNFIEEYNLQGTKNAYRIIGDYLDKNKESEIIIKELDSEFQSFSSEKKSNKKILFIYARGPRMLMVAGGNTKISKVITLAGYTNVANEIADYKPLNSEALIKYNPDVILFFDHGFKSFRSNQEITDIQGMKFTNAGKNKAYYSIPAELTTSYNSKLIKAVKTLQSIIK